MAEIKDYKLTRKEVEELSQPMALDMTALFSVMRDAVLETLDQSAKNGDRPDDVIRKIEDLFLDRRPGGVQKAVKTIHGFRDYKGVPVTIETRRGATRSGYDTDGKEWHTTMTHDYGYIRMTEGEDGEEIDVFVGPSDSDRVFLIYQMDPVTGEFDEVKVMLGFKTPEAARLGYQANYDRFDLFGEMEEVSIDEFKRMIGGKDA